GAPLLGLACWTLRDDHGGGGAPAEDPPPPDDGDPVDWPEFMRQLEQWKSTSPEANRAAASGGTGRARRVACPPARKSTPAPRSTRRPPPPAAPTRPA